MSVLVTKRNLVAAIEPLQGDVAVVTHIGTARSVQPIIEYEAAVKTAQDLADHMAMPVSVTPIDTSELLSLGGMTITALIDSLSKGERELILKDCITACEDAIRSSSEPKVVSMAKETLAQLSATGYPEI